LLGAAIDGNWQIRVLGDQDGSEGGTLVSGHYQLQESWNYTSVFSGPATIGAVFLFRYEQ